MIENELKHYREHFKGKTVLCNCDDPRVSNFFRYFVIYFQVLGLKKVIATCYKNNDADLFSEEKSEKAVYLEYDGTPKYTNESDFAKIPCKELKGDGDFRSAECVDFLKQADIVCTNPPFSLFREYIATLAKYGKKFVILGNINAVKYKEIFPLFMTDKIWLGYTDGHFWFQVPASYDEKATDYKMIDGIKYRRMGNICWFTNLDIAKRHEKLETGKKFDGGGYEKYDTYDAIEVEKNVDIPMDYDGVMGVPITFLTKHNPQQFKIIGVLNSGSGNEYDFGKAVVKGKQKYARILIQKIKQ